MPTVPLVPTVRRRRLGSALRAYRLEAGFDVLEDAAEAMGWDRSKLSRIETAKGAIKIADVPLLLASYGITDPEQIRPLEELARDAGKKGWWQTYTDLAAPSYVDLISLEDDAQSIRTYSPQLIPGLLQTAAYAREIIAATAITRTTEEVIALAEVRMARQAVLSRPGKPLKLRAIIHEAALHQEFPTRPGLMKEQLRRLLDAGELPTVTIQVMPLTAAAHPGQVGGFSLVDFPHPMPSMVETENLKGSSYVEGGEDTKLFSEAFEQVVAAALPVDDSTALIATLEGKAPK